MEDNVKALVEAVKSCSDSGVNSLKVAELKALASAIEESEDDKDQ